MGSIPGINTGPTQIKLPQHPVTPVRKWMETSQGHEAWTDFTAHTLTSAIFSSHSISVEAVSTPLTVGTIRVPNAPQTFPSDGVTVTDLQGVDIPTAVAGNTGFPRHRWVSVVTVCASA